MDAISKRDRFLPGNRAGDDFCAERYAKEFFGGGRGMAGACLCIDVRGGSIKYAGLDESRTLMDYGKIPTPYEGTEAYLALGEDQWKRTASGDGGAAPAGRS